MKKVLALLLTLTMLLGFASCAKKVEVPSKSDVKKAAAEEYDMEFTVDSEDVSDDEKEAEWVLVSKDGTLEVTVTWNAKKPEAFEFDDKKISEPTETDPTTTTTEEPTTTTTEEPTTTTTEESSDVSSTDSSDVGGGGGVTTGGKYVNFSEMNFYINGKKYTLGKTTLQEMIDDGVPFDSGDLEDAGNNIKKNYQSSRFKIDTGNKSILFYVQVFNDTSAGKPAKECYVNEIYYSSSDTTQTQNLVTFDFPLSLTMEDLKANAGDPNEKVYHNEDNPKYIYDTLDYTQKGKKYANKNRYSFDFKNNALRKVTIFYIP